MVAPHRRSRAAITAVFAANGALFASLYSRLPTLQAELGLSEGELGLALLAAPIGLIAAQVAGGGVAARLGSRPVTVAAGLATACVMVLPTLAGDLAALAGAAAARRRGQRGAGREHERAGHRGGARP